MIKRKCRACSQALFSEPLLNYKNMPKSAQFLPNADELSLDKGQEIEVYQCSACGLVQLNNDPVFYYKEVIRASALSEEMRTFRKSQFKQWSNAYALQGKSIIEIGCGAGEYLSMSPESEYKVFGLEYGNTSISECINQGFNVEKGFIDDKNKRLRNAPFDGFIMLNFLEHLPDPNSMLQGICNNLTDDAIGLVEVPNFDMILKQNLFSEFISDHLLYFTRDTFVSILNINGFDVLECNEVWHNYSISAVIRKRRKTDLSNFHRTQEELTKNIERVIAQFPESSVAIWGAGHQALTIMALAGLKGKIKYVIDSAVFKQNKFTPATHIPIVSPNAIKENPVKAVIVIAGSYTNEVVEQVYGLSDNELTVYVINGDQVQQLERL